jgi:hypothetical protein
LFATSGGRRFAVGAGSLYELDSAGTATLRGYLDTSSSEQISIAENETQLIICETSKGWIFTLATNVLAEITSADYNLGTHVVNIDGYFIKAGQVNFTGLHSGTVRRGMLRNMLPQKELPTVL